MGAEAKDAGIPLSKFVFEAVEAFRAARDETPKSEMVRELSEVKEEAQKLRSELKLKTLLRKKLEADVYSARYANFHEVEMSEGAKHYDIDKPLDGYSILQELAIHPSETKAVKLVNNQLESLRRFSLIEETVNGWRWIK